VGIEQQRHEIEQAFATVHGGGTNHVDEEPWPVKTCGHLRGRADCSVAMRFSPLSTCVLSVAGLLASGCAPESHGQDAGNVDGGEVLDGGWRPLFNGVDLTGWRRYLGVPGPDAGPLGFENDPNRVYSVLMEDGEPAIHISGEVWGSLVSTEEYGDFELEAEFKWGTHVYPPLDAFDSGLMYFSHGPPGAVNAGGPALADPIGSGAFLVSMEYQIAPGDVGALDNLGPINFAPGARVHAPERAGWNSICIVVSAGMATHFLNGQETASGSGFTSAWPGMPEAPLLRGTLQLQSEGGEIFFRRLRIRPLR